MFEWFSNMFQGAGAIDPEAGVPQGNSLDSLGRVQGPDEGTGEGWEKQKEMGGGSQSMQRAQVPVSPESPELIPAGLLTGFDQNWLAQAMSAGSANGQKL